MIANWMLYATLLGALFSAAALALERIARLGRVATRWSWIGAIGATCIVPILVALRPTQPMLAPVPTAPAAMADLRQQPLAFDAAPAPRPANDARPASDRRTSREPRGAGHGDGAPAAGRGRADPVTAHAPHPVIQASTNRGPSPWDPALVVLWILGSIAVAALIARSLVALHRGMRSWRRTHVGGASNMLVLVSSNIGPAVFGLLRMHIVVPEWALELDRPALDLMLAHERQHAKARDPLLLALGALAGIALPWNAMIWWQLARLRSAIEIDCDARVLRGAVPPRAYARLLVSVSGHTTAPVRWAAAFAQHHSLLERRITAMTDAGPRRPLLASAPFAVLAFLAMTAAVKSPRPAPLTAVHARLGTVGAETRRATSRPIDRSPASEVGLHRMVVLAPMTSTTSRVETTVPAPTMCLSRMGDAFTDLGGCMRNHMASSALLVSAFVSTSLSAAAQTGDGPKAITLTRPPFAGGTWMATNMAYGPWVIELTQAGTTLTGTVQQAGGERGPAEIREGTVQGKAVSFKVTSPDGVRTITFSGTISGDSLVLDRAVTMPAGGYGGATGVFGEYAITHFSVGRSDPTAAATALASAAGSSGACGADTSTNLPPQMGAPGSQRWVATDSVGFAPWVFDLTMKGGSVTGAATQSTFDPSGWTTSIPGPYEVIDGKQVGDTIRFSLRYARGTCSRSVSFVGTKHGDQITFNRSVQVVGSDPGMFGIVGASGAAHFTAKLLQPGDSLPTPTPAGRFGVNTVGGAGSGGYTAMRGANGAVAIMWSGGGAGAGPAVRQPHVPWPPAPGVDAVGPAGRWEVKDVGSGPWTFQFTTDDATLSGTVQQAAAPSSAVSIAAGKVDGAAVSFKVLSPDAQRTVTFTGRVNGDEISFSREVTPLAGGDRGGNDLFGASAATTFVAKRDNLNRLDYKGFAVDVAAAAGSPLADRDALLDAIRAQLDLVDAVKVDADTRQFFKTIPLVVVMSSGSAAYQSSGEHVLLPTHPATPYEADKPILLHELMHAYHDLELSDGFHNADIQRLYEQARTRQLFPADSYALSNVTEYFAMMLSVYLSGSAARDPFTRDAIRTKQPEMYQWLVKQFGAR